MSYFMRPIAEGGEDICVWCARPAVIRVTSPIGMAMWKEVTGEERRWLPYCESADCIIRCGIYLGERLTAGGSHGREGQSTSPSSHTGTAVPQSETPSDSPPAHTPPGPPER